jgi:hypothetical protein
MQAAALRIAYHSIRQDRSVVSPEKWQWNEGWPRVRQFFPRYFKSLRVRARGRKVESSFDHFA